MKYENSHKQRKFLNAVWIWSHEQLKNLLIEDGMEEIKGQGWLSYSDGKQKHEKKKKWILETGWF